MRLEEKRDKSSFAGSTKAFQENVTQAAPAMAAAYGLIGAIFLFAAIGYTLDKWQGTSPWFLLSGLALGIVVGFYELIKATYRK